MPSRLEDKIYGCLLGGLIGDAMGAPTEGKTFQQIADQFGPDGVTDFEGVGTDDTAIREQLIDAILKAELDPVGSGRVTCDEFAQSFRDHRQKNYRLWYIPVRNAFHKYDAGLRLPAYAGWDNMMSSSSAMVISPMGIVNACDPRRAVVETLDVASFIHHGASGFCRDGACAMAAAVAACFAPDATVQSVLDASTAHLLPVSAAEMAECIRQAVALGRDSDSYEDFRATFYERHLRPSTINDSRETVPAALGLLALAGDDPEQAIIMAANFGRDADTIATMVGGLAGALHGASALPHRWVAKVESNPDVPYRTLVPQLSQVIHQRADRARTYLTTLAALG